MIQKLIQKIQKTHAPIVVGLDPMLSYVPAHIQKRAFEEHGETLEGAAEAIWQYNKEIVDHVYDLIPAVKPQIAMYEQFGIPGLMAFKKTVDYCKSKDLVVIGDIKRGDIGSTSAAYAVGHLGKVKVGNNSFAGFDEDFVTVNPYLGTDGVKPFVDVCKEEKKGLFILVKTSNPSSGEFQDRLIDGRPLYELVSRLQNGARTAWVMITAMWEPLSEQLTRNRAKCCVRSCRSPLSWYRVMVHRAEKVQTWYTSSTKTDLVRS